MLHSADDSRLTPDQRCREVARILARGVLRLRQVALASREPGPAAGVPESPDKDLELGATGRPHVTAVNAAETTRGGRP